MRALARILCLALLLPSGALAADEDGWVRERLPLESLESVLADSYDDQVPLLSADMLVMAEASDAWLHEAARRVAGDAEHKALVRLTRDALLERWRTWKLTDSELTGALVNLLVDYIVLWRFHEPDEEFLLTFEKSLQIRLSSFYRGTAQRPPVDRDATPADLMRRYALEHSPDLTSPAGRKQALLWVHLMRTDPALAQSWEAARTREQRYWPGSDTPYRQVLEAAAGLPLGRMTDLADPKTDRAFATALRAHSPLALPLLPQAGRDDGAFLHHLAASLPRERAAWLRALGELPQAEPGPQPTHDPALSLAAHSPALALARWLMTAPPRPPADKTLALPLAEDWRVECRPELYRSLNRWHGAAAQQAEADGQAEALIRAEHHRRWQGIFGLLETCTPEPAHSALDFMRLPQALAEPHGPLMTSLAMLESLGRRLEGMGPNPPTLLTLWWRQTIRAELPHSPIFEGFQEVDQDSGDAGDFLPPLVPLPPEGGEGYEPAAPVDFDHAPAPRRISLVTLRLSIGKARLHETQHGEEPGDIVPVGPRPPLHLSLPE